jgi:hypothetical protein
LLPTSSSWEQEGKCGRLRVRRMHIQTWRVRDR